MCQYDRTIYTICAHPVDKRIFDCTPATLRNGLGLFKRHMAKDGPCNWHRPGNAYLKVGWCPACAERLRTAYKNGHPRKIKLNDEHVVHNFWAWRSQIDKIGMLKIKTKDIPLDVIDQADRMEYRLEEGIDTPVYLTYAHWELSDNAPYSNWHQLHPHSLFSNTDKSSLVKTTKSLPGQPFVPSLRRMRFPDGTLMVPIEHYAVWFALYEFQPAVVHADPDFITYSLTRVTADIDVAELAVSGSMVETRDRYCQDLMRDAEGIRAQDVAERRSRERERQG